MATQLGLVSLNNPLQKLAQSHDKLAAITLNAGGALMWNSNQQAQGNQDHNDDSWQVRAFEQDTNNNAMGTTWPPRSYTCTFCTREFRSAQALGGHMNVHRRERARLHQIPPPATCSEVTTSTAAVIMNSNYHQELVANGGVCLIYSLPNPNAVFSPSKPNHSTVSSSEILPAVSPYTTNFMLPKCPPPSPINFSIRPSVRSSLGYSSITQHLTTSNDNFNEDCLIYDKKVCGEIEIDLELRLGRGSRPW